MASRRPIVRTAHGKTRAGHQDVSERVMRDSRSKVSVIIPTYNRASSLREALLSLSRLDFPEGWYEIVVVDDGSTDETERVMATLQSAGQTAIRYLKQKEHRGASAARNSGIKMAGGEILVFTDDDCLFQREWLSLLLAPFDSAEVGMVGGPDRAPEGSSFSSKCADYLLTSFIGTGGLREKNRLRAGRYYPRSCNMAIRRDVLAQVGLFDEDLFPGEEIELAYRVEKAGCPISFAPDAYVWHKRRANLREHLRKIYAIGHGRVALARKHSGLFQMGHMIPFFGVVAVLVLAGLSFFFGEALHVLTFLVCGYAAILLIGGLQALFRIEDIRALLIIPPMIALQHSTHGVGFLVGVIQWAMGSRASVRSG